MKLSSCWYNPQLHGIQQDKHPEKCAHWCLSTMFCPSVHCTALLTKSHLAEQVLSVQHLLAMIFPQALNFSISSFLHQRLCWVCAIVPLCCFSLHQAWQFKPCSLVNYCSDWFEASDLAGSGNAKILYPVMQYIYYVIYGGLLIDIDKIVIFFIKVCII